jgi:hypothetical protein
MILPKLMISAVLGASSLLVLPGCQTPPRAHPEALIGEVEAPEREREARPRPAPRLHGKSLQYPGR